MPTALSPSRTHQTSAFGPASNGTQRGNGLPEGPSSSRSPESRNYQSNGHVNGSSSTDAGNRPAGEEEAEQDDDDDWLLSDEDLLSHHDRGNFQTDGLDESGDFTMSNRDSAKVQRTFYDTGYREGITAGKLSTLQGGFDQGFNQSASVGRLRGLLRGEVNAAQIWLEQQRQQQNQSQSSGPRPLSDATTNLRTSIGSKRSNNTLKAPGVSASSLTETDKENVRLELTSIMSNLTDLDVDSLLEPDWEALAHEGEHAGEAASKTASSSTNGHASGDETAENKREREARLIELQRRVEACLEKTLR